MTPNRDDADVRKSLMEEGLPTWTKNIPKRSLIAPVGPAPEKPTITPFQLLLLAVMVLQNSAVVLLGRYTQTHENSKPYSASNLVVAAEMLKFIACMVLAALDVLYARFPSPGLFPNLPASSIVKMLPAAAFEVALGLLRDPKNSLVVAPVAFLYLLQNNILYVALRNLSAPIFQVCYQTKLVTTALLSVMMIEGRVYSRIQWTALVALSFGVAIAVMTGDGGSSESNSNSHNNAPLGLFCCFIATLSSGLAGVYFEKVIKSKSEGRPPTSLWIRNIELAFFSVIFGSTFRLFSGKGLSGPDTGSSFFEGFTFTVILLCALQAFGGLVVACIVKYADNVMKGLATGVSLVFATTMSAIFMSTSVQLGFIFGSAIILSSVFAFTNHKKFERFV